ncbi:hypothetical protein [Acidithiobacillus ferrivorans]|uniref:Uncharacterized protein n=1 Tax=Acidithiobacillus ferrivorans TaxID=160808 RepID=A0A7T5BG04_9PROT|nr:hypothetical protein [Acidithiobacillus ferrivorans]QQD71784.1 hypothetical protein H2515_10030 [Acidithiobacillus ferrivorans]
MASIPTRKEPVLAEQLEAGDEAPLLLTHLLREGLPPQLWRYMDNEMPAARAGYAQTDPHWLDTATVAPRPTVNEDIEEHEPDAAPTPPPIPEMAAMQARATDTVAPAVSTAPIDLDFLKNFEGLLFQEIERRIIHEVEGLVTEHLQTLWKEQVSLTIMRTLALEGIQLRESLAGDIRKALPEILQRVLHEGLDQINTSEIE